MVDRFVILIKYKAGEMQIDLDQLFNCSDRFSRAKKLIRLSLISDWDFSTNNHAVWNSFIAEHIDDYELGLSRNKCLEAANFISESDKLTITRRIHSLETAIKRLKSLLDILNTPKPIKPKRLF